MITYDENDALRDAVEIGKTSPCKKSKRGVVVFARGYGIMAVGANHPPVLMRCDGSAECREHCRDLCVHAEADALLALGKGHLDSAWQHHTADYWGGKIDMSLPPYRGSAIDLEVLHVKVEGDKAVPSGSPSCVRCSALLCDDQRIRTVWLLHEEGLRGYTRMDFHTLSLRCQGLPVIR